MQKTEDEIFQEVAKKVLRRVRKVVRELQDHPNVYTKGLTPSEVMKLLGPYVIACSDVLSKLDDPDLIKL